MDDGPTYTFFYSLGTVLAGYLLTLPLWALGAFWNHMQPKRAFNPWLPPLTVALGIYFCFAIVILHLHEGDLNTAIVVLGLLPGTIGCAVAARRYHRAQSQRTVEL